MAVTKPQTKKAAAKKGKTKPSPKPATGIAAVLQRLKQGSIVKAAVDRSRNRLERAQWAIVHEAELRGLVKVTGEDWEVVTGKKKELFEFLFSLHDRITPPTAKSLQGWIAQEVVTSAVEAGADNIELDDLPVAIRKAVELELFFEAAEKLEDADLSDYDPAKDSEGEDMDCVSDYDSDSDFIEEPVKVCGSCKHVNTKFKRMCGHCKAKLEPIYPRRK